MAKSSIQPEGKHANVPKIFQGIPELPKFKAPGPIKKALKDINYIKELNTIPCGEASWAVIAKTGIDTAAPALLTLFLPGCTDIVKTKLGLSPWHARGIKGLIHKAAPPLAVSATKFLWNIGYFAAEKYLWFFQVAEVTKDFFITWQSQVYMQQQCQLPGAGTAYGYITPFVYGGHQEGGLSITPLKLCPGVSVGLNNIQISPGFQGSIAWSVQWQSWPDPSGPCNVSTWEEETDLPTPLDFMTTFDPNLNNNNTTGGHQYLKNDSLSAGKQLKLFMASNNETNVAVVGGTWSCSTQGRHSGLTSFGCFPKKAEWPFPSIL
jgi:hypothetical protein